MELVSIIKDQTVRAVKELFGEDVSTEIIQVQDTRKEFDGDYTIVVFPLLKISKSSPEETGKKIGEFIVGQSDVVVGFNVIKGFLNLVIDSQYWVDFLKTVANDDDFGQTNIGGDVRVMIEYCSPNTNKPLHLGHLRNIFLGYSADAILKANGFTSIPVCLYNDRGINVSKSMLAYLRYGEGETPQTTGIKGDHFVVKFYLKFGEDYKKEVEDLISKGLSKEEAEKKAPSIIKAQEMVVKWEQGDEEITALWKKMNQWVYDGFEETYSNLGINFEKYYYESETYLLGKRFVEEGLEKGIFFKKDDGSIWVDLTDEGLDEKLLLRSDGTAVYMTQDMGTAQLKYDDYKMDESVYVVGNEQDYHFKVLKLIMQKLDKPYANGIQHLSYGMVDLPTGRMKTREGTVVDADDLVAEMIETARIKTNELGKAEELSESEARELYRKVGLAALKYYILKVDPKKRMVFNPEESIDFTGNTGPFIQYTYARIQSLLRKFKVDFQSQNFTVFENIKLTVEEREIVKLIYQYPDVVREAGENFSPALIANYTYELVKSYNHFYQTAPPILKEHDADLRNFRIAISYKTGIVIHSAMNLLGIEVPEKM